MAGPGNILIKIGADTTDAVRGIGAVETLKAFKGLDADLRKQANGELRAAAGVCARRLVELLQASAASSGVPVAPRVARSAKVKSDRLPAVSVGGSRRVGRYGAPASALVWGSERGPRGDVNHWAVPPSAGHWIRPAVKRFEESGAPEEYSRAVDDLIQRYGLA